MKRCILIFLACTALFSVFCLRSEAQIQSAFVGADPEDGLMSKLLLRHINEARRQNSLPPLVLDERISIVSRKLAAGIARGETDPTNFRRTTDVRTGEIRQRLQNPSVLIEENLGVINGAESLGDMQKFVELWTNDQAARRRMMSNATRCGAGIAISKGTGNRTVVTVAFVK